MQRRLGPKDDSSAQFISRFWGRFSCYGGGKNHNHGTWVMVDSSVAVLARPLLGIDTPRVAGSEPLLPRGKLQGVIRPLGALVTLGRANRPVVQKY